MCFICDQSDRKSENTFIGDNPKELGMKFDLDPTREDIFILSNLNFTAHDPSNAFEGSWKSLL